ATVTSPIANVRSGPGVQFDLVDTVPMGQAIAVIGRLADCTWLQVVRPAKGQGWVAANLVVLSRPCQDLPAVAPPLLDRARSATSSLAASSAPGQALAVASVSVPPEQSPPAPADVACTGLPQENYA